jgi:hypothetical protein
MATKTGEWCDGTGHDFDNDESCKKCGGSSKLDY